MKICASTCSHEQRLWSNTIDYSIEESLTALHDTGYEAVDLCLCSYARGAYPLTQPAWQTWCENLKNALQRIGIEPLQAHAPFYALQSDNTENPHDRLMMERGIIAAGMTGVKTMVFHPFQVTEDGWFSYEKSKETNLRLFREYAELCRPFGVRIAIENMIGNDRRGRRYCSGPDELIDLVDTLNDPLIGICWDFGHANLNGINQPAALRKIGKRLYAVHVNDNKGMKDDHIAPFLGTVNWMEIMPVIKEIGYDGAWAYEIFNFHNGLPEEMKKAALEYSRVLAEYLISLTR